MKKRIISSLLAASMIFTVACSGSEEAAETQVLTGTAKGYGGELKVEVTLDGETITGVTVVEHKETEGIGTPAVDALPALIVEANSTEVDTVAGATVTSQAIIYAVNNAMDPEMYPAEEVVEGEVLKEVTPQTATMLYQGTGMSSTAERLNQSTDDQEGSFFYQNKVYANAIFDQDGKIINLTIDQVESGTPNIKNPYMPHFYGWPGQTYNHDEDHDGVVDEQIEITEEVFLNQFSEWKTKRERGETYMMTSGSWSSQMNAFETLFTGMTVEEVEAWYEAYTSNINGRPLNMVEGVADEDKAKFDALTAEEQTMLTDLTASASMSVNDAHGNVVEAIVDAFEQKEEITATEIVKEGFGASFVGRVGPGSDETETPVYSFNETFAYVTFDSEDKIVSINTNVYEIMTPNYDGADKSVFIGWPGQSYNNDEDGDGTIDGVIESTEENMKENANNWTTKNEKGDSYVMGAGSWEEQMDAFEELFIGMTAAEVEAWYTAYTSDVNGRPLQEDSSNEEDVAKYEALTDDEKAMLTDLTASATMSLNDAHGDIVKAIVDAFANSRTVDITVG